MDGSRTNIRILVLEEIPNSRSSRLTGDTIERPKSGFTGLGFFEPIDIANLSKSLDGPLDHSGPLVRQPLDLWLFPIQFQTTGIFEEHFVLPFNPINCSKNIGFRDFGGRTTDHVPTAGISHQKAPIRILDHISWVKVVLLAFEQDAHPSRISRSVMGQPVM